VNVSHEAGTSEINTVKMAFTDGNTWINSSYDGSEWTLDSGSDVVNLRVGTAIDVEDTMLQVTFLIYLENDILDALNVDIWMFSNDTDGNSDGWEVMQTDYFNIYNLGGHSELSSSGTAGRLDGGDVFDLYAEASSWVEVNVTWRNLQHVKMLPQLYMEGSCWYWNLEFYMDYYVANDSWVEGWGFKTNLTGILATSDNRWIQMNVTWLSQGNVIKSQNISMFFDVSSLGNKTYRFWIDLWFNRINASSTVGGRINAYYFPMKNNAEDWLRWLTGNNWGPNDELVKQSMMFTDLVDSSGNVISAALVQMVRLRCKLTNPPEALPNYRIELSDFDVFDLTIGHGRMEGVQTPVFDESRVPMMPQGGFLGAVWSALTDLAKGISEALGPVILGFWNIFVGFMDSIFSFFGWANGFSTILTWITSLLDWLGNAFTWIISFLTSTFAFLTAILGKLLNTVSTVTTQLVTIIQNIFSMLGGGLGTGVNIWESLNLAQWVVILAILYPIFLFGMWEEKGIDAVLNHLNMVLNIFAWIFRILITVVQMFIHIISSIIEAIPVVE